MTSTIWIVIVGVLFSLLCVSIFFNFRHALIILKIADRIEDSLDVLDERYASISNILEMPVFFDSLEIRQVIKEITESRDAVLYVANSLIEIENPAQISEEKGDE
jgi:hypothetical protein